MEMGRPFPYFSRNVKSYLNILISTIIPYYSVKPKFTSSGKSWKSWKKLEELAATTKKNFLTFRENYVIISYKVERG